MVVYLGQCAKEFYLTYNVSVTGPDLPQERLVKLIMLIHPR